MATHSQGSPARKPRLIFCAMPFEGHTRPVAPIAEAMAERGFPTTFIGMHTFAGRLERTGIKFVPLPSWPGAMDPSLAVERSNMEPGLEMIAWDVRHLFLGQMEQHWDLLRRTMVNLHNEDPGWPMVILVDYGFIGANVLCHGAPLPGGMTVRPKVIHLGITPYLASSIDTAPWPNALPPDSTPSGRARNAVLDQLMDGGPFAECVAFYRSTLKLLGAAVQPRPRLMDSLYLCQDRVLQMSPPGLEYERSDLPSHVTMVGTLPPRPVDPGTTYPPWWSEVTSGNKRIVMVSQGTVAVNYDDLLMPTIRSLADRDDLIIVAILGVKGADLPQSASPLPSNTRTIDYLPFDTLLPHAAVFVTNGGWGGVLHAVTNGTPVVLAGASEDKPYVSSLAAWAGIGVNLAKGRPSEEEVRQAVDRVLADGGGAFKERVERMRVENASLDPLGDVERCVWVMAQGW